MVLDGVARRGDNLYDHSMTSIYLYDGAAVTAVEAPAERPLRWAAWRPDGASALLVGTHGQVLRFDGRGFETLPSNVAHNLRGAAWAPDASRALLVGNRGAIVVYDGKRFSELPPATAENLRRVAWAPDGSCALIAGNAGCVLRFDAGTGTLIQLPGDRAHTMRSIAWRPDSAYALIGAYASRHAGYPRPYALYRCDGRFVQGILATDDEDDACAIDWKPGGDARALILVARYSDDGARLPGKIVSYDGAGFSYRSIPRLARAEPSASVPGEVVTLLGLGWHPSGDVTLLCGEHGKLLSYDGQRMRQIPTGTRDNFVGPFWQPGASKPVALMLKGPDEKVYTI
jgi:hypothetical protein